MTADRLVAAVLDRIVPADADPSAVGFGAEPYVSKWLAVEAVGGPVRAGLEALAATARQQHGAAFEDLGADTQDALLQAIEDEAWFATLVRLTAEGVYADPDNGGNRDAASWRMVGYEHRLPEGPTGPALKPDPAPRRMQGASGTDDYDVVVIGAGAGGGVIACELSEAGKTVLLIERGLDRNYANDGHRDHLRNHRYARYGHNTGPELEGNPRVAVDLDGNETIVQPHELAWGNNASGVGSGTVVFGGMAWRFHPDDFRMASRYGVPEGSSLVDWPIGYDDLAPWYEKAEWEIGVAGHRGNVHEGPRARDYPMPPLSHGESARVLGAGAEKLGLSTFSPPFLINTQQRYGRAACIGCGSCVGFPCPSDAKNGTHNTMIPRALATGRCTLLTGAVVTRVEHGPQGRITGVTMVHTDELGVPHTRTINAKAVVLSAGAIESARLLLLSRSSLHPDGLGNDHDIVGRHLQGHYYPTAYGLFREPVHDTRGPGVTIGTCDFNHGNDGIIGGAMICDDFVTPPIMFWETALPPRLRRWGADAKNFMRSHYRHVAQIKGPVHEIPAPDCRVTLADITDRHGARVARLSGAVHPETMRTADFIQQKGLEWLRASGAIETWSNPTVRIQLSSGQHQAGTCRMGTDPTNSVTDSFGRVWGHDNLFVSDSSLHPTNGGFNPVLTIMAMAFRNAKHIAASI